MQQKNLIDDADGVYGWLAEAQQPIQSVGTLIIAGPGAGTSIGEFVEDCYASQVVDVVPFTWTRDDRLHIPHACH